MAATTSDHTIPPQRINIRCRFAIICDRYPRWAALPVNDRERLVRHIERSCFTLAVNECTIAGINRVFTEARFVARYSAICSKVLANLDTTGSVGSTYLIDRIITGTVDPLTVADMGSIDLCPAASKEEREMIERRQGAKTELKVSRAYTCSKCHGNETIPIKYQSRAADEDSSTSIKCVTCGNRWRR